MFEKGCCFFWVPGRGWVRGDCGCPWESCDGFSKCCDLGFRKCPKCRCEDRCKCRCCDDKRKCWGRRDGGFDDCCKRNEWFGNWGGRDGGFEDCCFECDGDGWFVGEDE